MRVSLQLAVPVFVLQVVASTAFALLLVFFRHSRDRLLGRRRLRADALDLRLFYIIVGQFLFSRVLHLVPISGYVGLGRGASSWCCRSLLSLLSRLGTEARLYRAMFLEEIGKDYVRTARAKGLSEAVVLFRHVLRNALIPIITSAGSYLPYVFLGSLVFESFFGIPGPRRLRHRSDPRPGLRDRPLDGLRRLAALHRQLRADRRRLHLGRSPGAPRMNRADAQIRLPLDRRRRLRAGVLGVALGTAGASRARPNLRATWRKVLRDRGGALLVARPRAVLRRRRWSTASTSAARSPPRRAPPPAQRRPTRRARESLLDVLLSRADRRARDRLFGAARDRGLREGTGRSSTAAAAQLSAPAARRRAARRSEPQWGSDVLPRGVTGLVLGALVALRGVLVAARAARARRARRRMREALRDIARDRTDIPLRAGADHAGRHLRCCRADRLAGRGTTTSSAPTAPATTCSTRP